MPSPGDRSLLLSDGKAISKSNPAVGDPVVMHSPEKSRDGSNPAVGDQTLLISEAVAQGAAAGVTGLPDPIHHWKFNEQSGSTAVDSAGSADGTIQGSGILLGQPGKDGTAFEFPGSGDNIVDIGSIPESPSEFTITIWAYQDTVPTSGITQVWEFGSGSTPETRIEQEAGEGMQFFHQGTKITLNSAYPDQWAFFVARFDGTNMSFVRNDFAEEVTGTSSGSLSSSPIAAANDPESLTGGSYQPFDGRLDDFRVYDQWLDDDQISTLFNSY